MGITGKVASGKSTVTRYVKKIKKGTLIIDADKIAKNIYKKDPEILEKLRQFFGEEIFDSEDNLIFKVLAEKVFSDKKELVKLNKLMFPLIRSEIENILNKNHKRDYIIIDAAILFDCGLDDLCDYIIYVKNSVRRKRLFLKNKGFSDNDIELKIDGQQIKTDKKKIDFIIDNDGSKKSLFKKVEKISAAF
ncbi:MAG: dephospho-CoA kinase [Actinobacteria bacterium RBG_19FT_COMBO_36_27]|nr:MAG: dephospho-CoA kinase [Actinobacteria bacterium RBG_19FT_COMBO_36_27]